MKVTTQKNINEWLAGFLQKSVVIAPVETEGKIVYRQIEEYSQIAWDFERTDMPPKTAVFPMTEPILYIEQGSKTILKNPPIPKNKIVFGVRPCDARSMLALDALFINKEPIDPQYAHHRESVTLIGLSCPQMWDSCFCTVVGGAPNSNDGLDILITKVGDHYAVQTFTEKGTELTDKLISEEKDLAIPKPVLTENLPTLQKSGEWMELFNNIFWEELSQSCISCRACSFVCPTCRCFDVRDELTAFRPGVKEFERLRAWDSCTAAGYRRIAGGHNPRDTQNKRLRNRFYCKFSYYPDDFGPLGCVGCGRCVDACPAGINILEVITRVEQMTEREKVNG